MVLVRDSKDAPPRDVVELTGVTKVHPGAVRALDGVTGGFARGTFTAVMGPSGSGKSTLLHCAAGLDRPTSGRVVLAGQDIGALREPKLTTVRRARVGFVFESFNLVDALSVWDNVLLPQRLAGARPEVIFGERAGPGSGVRRRPAGRRAVRADCGRRAL